jgi:hypothetical protein
MIYSPERENSGQNQGTYNYIYIKKISSDQLAAHSVCADPPLSRPIGLFFFVLLHVVSAFAGHQLLIFTPLRWAGPTLTPSPHVDPTLLRTQATARFHVRHNEARKIRILHKER